jgi:hypothetical protein
VLPLPNSAGLCSEPSLLLLVSCSWRCVTTTQVMCASRAGWATQSTTPCMWRSTAMVSAWDWIGGMSLATVVLQGCLDMCSGTGSMLCSSMHGASAPSAYYSCCHIPVVQAARAVIWVFLLTPVTIAAAAAGAIPAGEWRLYVCCNDSTVKVFALPSMLSVTVLRCPCPINYVALSPHGNTLVAVGDCDPTYLYQATPAGGGGGGGVLCLGAYVVAVHKCTRETCYCLALCATRCYGSMAGCFCQVHCHACPTHLEGLVMDPAAVVLTACCGAPACALPLPYTLMLLVALQATRC